MYVPILSPNSHSALIECQTGAGTKFSSTPARPQDVSDGQFLFDPQDAELTAEEFNRLVDSYDLSGWLELDQRCGNYTRRAQYHSLKAAGYNVDAIDGYFDDDDKTTDDAEQN